MEYSDFYDIAEYGNENWRGGFSHREIAENAYIYKTEYDALGLDSQIIQTLVELLTMDLNETTSEWIDRITER